MNLKKNIFHLSLIMLLLSGSNTTLFCQTDTAPKTKDSIPDAERKVGTGYMRDLQAEAKIYFQSTRSGYKQYKRLEQYLLPRLGSNGRIINSTAKNLQAYDTHIKPNLQSNQRGIAHNGNWEFIGPTSTVPHPSALAGGIGRVNRFAFHPTDPNTIYAATAGGGIWKTEDQGVMWEPLSDGIPVMNTCGVAVDFTDTDIIYALSGDGALGSFFYDTEFSRLSVGVIKTYDGGTIWQPTGLKFDEQDMVAAFNLHMSPVDPLVLYACTSVGLFRTDNGGNTWDTLREGKIYEIEFKPGSPQTIYCVDDDRVYVSNTGGDTWIDSTLIPAVDGENGRMSITTCPGDPDLVYLIASPVDTLDPIDTLPDTRGFWVSTDSGLSFTLVTTRPNILAASDGDEFKSQAWYDFGSVCNPLDPEEIIIAAIGIWRSSDSGDTWTHVTGINSLYHADVQAVEINPLDNTLYLATDGGVYISEDFGNTYEFRSGFLAITQYYFMATSPFLTEHTLAGSQDNGVHFRNDVETEHDHVVFGDGMECLFHPTYSHIALATWQEAAILISVDTGQTYTTIFGPIDTTTGPVLAGWTTPIAFHAQDSTTIYIGTKPIMKTTDMGETWSATSADTISGLRILINTPAYPNILYAGDCRNCDDTTLVFEFYRTLDGGFTWARIDQEAGFPDSSFVTAAALNPDDSQEIWVTCGRYEADKKVFRTINGGINWINVTGSLPNIPVNQIAFEDNNGSPGGAVYIATDIGVYYRNDDLDDWIWFSNHLPMVEVTDLDIDYNGGFLRASTYGRGLWQSELYTSCDEFMVLDVSNQPIGHSFVHRVSDYIFSTAIVDGYASKVIYTTEGHIYLGEGFRATSKRGAQFRAFKGDCDATGVEIIPLISPEQVAEVPKSVRAQKKKKRN